MSKFDDLEARVTALEEAAAQKQQVVLVASSSTQTPDVSLEQRVADLEKLCRTLRK